MYAKPFLLMLDNALRKKIKKEETKKPENIN